MLCSPACQTLGLIRYWAPHPPHVLFDMDFYSVIKAAACSHVTLASVISVVCIVVADYDLY